jgi:pimeloyl-ACP methyl ester carboxylesterase
MTDRLDQQVKLRDGRIIGFADLGDPKGSPVFHFHGGSGSRFEGLHMDKTAQKKGIRLICPDRPGIGLSTFKPGRKVSDWPDDVSNLADELKFERFGVYGISGGGPYALACAAKIPQRLISASSVSGLGPFNQPDAYQGLSKTNSQGYKLLQSTPWMFGLSILSYKMLDLKKFFKNMMASMPEPDRKVLENPEVFDIFIRTFKGAVSQKVGYGVLDAKLYVQPWDFFLEKITMKVHVWQGEVDQNVSPAMGHYLARTIPNCQAHFFANEAHLSMFYNHKEEILDTVINP